MDTLRDLITQAGWAGLAGALGKAAQGGPADTVLDASTRPVVGIDVGGTKVHGLGWSPAGGAREVVEPVAPSGGLDAVRQIARMAYSLAGDTAPGAVTVGLPGSIEPETGYLIEVPNLPGWERFDALSALQDACGADVAVENDVNLAAWGEHMWLSSPDVAFVAVGTGVGVGLVIGGQLHRGHRGTAGEVFDIPALPTFPHAGAELEDVASGPGLERTFRMLTGTARSSYAILEAYPASPSAVQAVTAMARPLAHLIYAIGSLLDPRTVVLGGGVGAREDVLCAVRSQLDALGRRPPRVVHSTFGPRAAAIGAFARSIHCIAGPAWAPARSATQK